MRISLPKLVLFLLVVSACQQSLQNEQVRSELEDQPVNQLDELARWMTGTFTSEIQSRSDTDFFHISLEMHPVWEDRTDGKWLYVEQALAEKKDKPYRQRVYQLIKTEDGNFESKVYALPDPLRFAGCWRETDPLASITVDSLLLRNGCSVFLTRSGAVYKGGTNERDCVSTLRGAAYATTIVEVHEDKIISWDRGFSANGDRVWGAEKGGYVFDKR